MQVKAMDQSSGQVNVVSSKPHSKGTGKRTAQGRGRGNKPGKPSSSSQETKVSGCLCCNYTDHMASDQNCPARSKKCNAYSEIGHFAVSCKTKELKPSARDDEGRNNARRRAYQLSEDSATGQQDYYAFAVGVGQPKSGSQVDLKTGGVMLPVVHLHKMLHGSDHLFSLYSILQSFFPTSRKKQNHSGASWGRVSLSSGVKLKKGPSRS